MLKRTLFICTILVACSEEENNTAIKTQTINSASAVAYPYHGVDGNRFVSGSIDLPNTTALDIELPSEVRWIAALKSGDNSIWTASLASGEAKAFKVSAAGYEAIEVLPQNTGIAMPLTVVLTENSQPIIANNFADGTPYSSPVIVDITTGQSAYIATNGDLVLVQGDNSQRLAVDAVNYSRILIDENQRLLLLTKPTLSYDHQVLGSEHPNAGAISIIQTSPRFEVLSSIEIEPPDVIEGNPLIWMDVNNDGAREIITTLSNIDEGARIVIFNENGSIYAEGAPINIGYRWRHQLAIAPFNTADELSLASVYIPHLGPNIEFFRLDDKSMFRDKLALDYSSHLEISLNLDKSIAGDFDNDGKPEVLLINRDSQSELAAVSLSNSVSSIDWTISLNGAVSSNIAAVTLDNDQIALGIGQGNSLRVWHP